MNVAERGYYVMCEVCKWQPTCDRGVKGIIVEGCKQVKEVNHDFKTKSI